MYIKDDINGRNVLHWACYHGHADLVDILVNHFNMLTDATDRDGKTARDLAYERSRTHVLKKLPIDKLSPGEIESVLNNPVKLKALAKAAFDTVDTDGSGEIDESEFQRVVIQLGAEVGSQRMNLADLSRFMKELDTDGNGMIDLQEFEVLVRGVLENLQNQSK